MHLVLSSILKWSHIWIPIISTGTGNWVSVVVRYSYVHPSKKCFLSWYRYFKIITVNQSTLSYNFDGEITPCNTWMYMLGIEHKLTIRMGNQNCLKINVLDVTSVCVCMWMYGSVCTPARLGFWFVRVFKLWCEYVW